MPLLCISKLLTGGDPNFRMEFVGGEGTDVKGAFQIHEGSHGAVPPDFLGQARQAFSVWGKTQEQTGLGKYGVPAEGKARLAAYLAVCAVAWRRPSTVARILEDEPEPPIDWGNVIEAAGAGRSEGRIYEKKVAGWLDTLPHLFVVGEDKVQEADKSVGRGLPDWALWGGLVLGVVGFCLVLWKVLKK